MFLSDFTESKIELIGHILVIDGKRYLNRGAWLISGIDLKNRVVYKEGSVKSLLFDDESVSFQAVELIPLFYDKKRGY